MLYAYTVYRRSDGAMTRAFYAALLSRGSSGAIAMHLFRAQKCSRRAKKYGPYAGIGRATYRDLAYQRKAESLKALGTVLGNYAEKWGIGYGWGRDPHEPRNPWVLYVDLPQGQVSFHSAERYGGPDYPREWDGIRGASESRIIEFCQAVYERRVTKPAEEEVNAV